MPGDRSVPHTLESPAGLPEPVSRSLAALADSDPARWDLDGLLAALVESTGAAAGVIFVSPGGASDVAAFRRRSVTGIAEELQDRVVLPGALARRLEDDRDIVTLRAGGQGTPDIGQVFAPLRRRLASGVAVGSRGLHRCVAVWVLGFSEAGREEEAAPLVAEVALWSGPPLERSLLLHDLAAGERRYRALMDGAVDGITLYDPVRDMIVDCNTAAESLFGRARADLLGSAPPEVLSYLRASSLSSQVPAPRSGCFHGPDGRDRPFEVTGRLVELDGRTLLLSIFRDRRDLVRSEAELRASQQRFALAAEGCHGGLWDWDVAAGVVYYSPRWKAMLGYEGEEIGDTPGEWFRRVHPDDLDRMNAALQAHLAGATPHFEDEHRLRRKDGTWLWVLARGMAIREHGLASRMAGSIADVSQRRLVEERLLQAAFQDSLTLLPNRALFMDRLSQILAVSRRHSEACFAVLVLDVDRFKVVNDSLGHAVGDELLVAIARRLERCVRPADTVARLGGDEFTILLPEVGGVRGANRFAERIQAELVRPFRLAGQEVFASVSIGVAMGGAGSEDGQALLRDADLAMYQAKANGKARCEVFDREMHARALDQLQLETDLRRALEREEFELHYQPLVSLVDGSLRGFEALVRWRHPTRGLVAPGDFLPMAEDTGLIVPLGSWVLKTACATLARWRQGGRCPLAMSVNLAGRQIEQSDLVEEVAGVLVGTGLPADCLVLEVTENVVMSRATDALALLQQLKALGVRLHMDDFGTGLASLAYLRDFPMDSLKIDRSFVQRMTLHPEDEEIVRTIVNLGRNLRLGVIAEGIETSEQLDRLRSMGCDLGQGYHISRPMPEADAAAFAQRAFG